MSGDAANSTNAASPSRRPPRFQPYGNRPGIIRGGPRGGPRNFQRGSRNDFQAGRGAGFAGGNRRSFPTDSDFSTGSHSRSHSAQSTDFRAIDQRGAPLQQSPINLYRVTIPLGKRYSKEYILQTLATNSSQIFTPLQYHFESQSAVFFVNGHDVAESLKQCSGRITTNLNLKLIVVVSPSRDVPPTDLVPDVLDKLRDCLSRRFDATRKHLDLSRLASDSVLMSELISLPLTRTVNHNAVFQLVLEKFPELESLDLSDNRLQGLSLYADLWEKLPRLRALNLSTNQLRNERELDKLPRAKTLEEIALSGNPFLATLTNQSEWALSFRRKFPKLRILDGVVLPPQTSFAIEHQDLNFPQTQPNYFGAVNIASQAQSLIEQFLQEYFGLYDSDKREALKNAYSEESLFSVTCFINMLQNEARQPHFAAYAEDTRNVRSRTPRESTREERDRRHKTLHKGAEAIIGCLRRLPPTRHRLTTFAIDVVLFNNSILIFSVSGYFKEMPVESERIQPIRSFSRVFVTAPRGNGLVIQNDMLTISNASYDMMQKLRSLERASERAAAAAAATSAASTASSASAPSNLVVNVPGLATQSDQRAVMNVGPSLNAAPLQLQASVQLVGDMSSTASAQQHLAAQNLAHSLAAVTIAPGAPLIQQQSVPAATASDPQEREREAAVLALSQHTGMNLQWARKCLEENRWDLNASIGLVKILVEHNKIPPEAFAK